MEAVADALVYEVSYINCRPLEDYEHRRPGSRIPRDALGRGRSFLVRARGRNAGATLRRMVEFLLKRGAATNLPDDEPWAKPPAWATRHGRSDIVELLKQHGAT